MSAAVAVTRFGSRTASSPSAARPYRIAIERRHGLVRSGPGRLRLSIPLRRRFSFSQTVIGAFSDFEGGSINGSSSFPGFTGSERESSTWAVGGRAGVLVTPRFLTYFDGGFTQARFDGVNYNFAFAGGGPAA